MTMDKINKTSSENEIIILGIVFQNVVFHLIALELYLVKNPRFRYVFNCGMSEVSSRQNRPKTN